MTRSTRLAKNASSEARGPSLGLQQDQARADDEGTELSLEERMNRIRNEFVQEALPDVPAIPGFHLCWLSTTHSYDTIHRRMRLGYVLVRQSEVPGYQVGKMNSGEDEDHVRCNEMILAKVPMEIYQMIMQEFHHDRPLREEEAISARIAEFTKADAQGKDLTVRDEGFEERELVRRAKVPTFT